MKHEKKINKKMTFAAENYVPLQIKQQIYVRK